MSNKSTDRCYGCRTPFTAMNMTAKDGYSEAGKIYCNSDCAMEAEVAQQEQDELDYLASDDW